MPRSEGLTDLRRAAMALAGGGGRLAAAAIILDDAGAVLMVRHAFGHRDWSLPGGGTGAGESLAAAVVRAVREQTGLEVETRRLTGLYYETETDTHHAAFVCAPQRGASAAANRPDIGAVGYFPPDRLPRPVRAFAIRRVRDALADAPVTGITIIPRRRWLGRGASTPPGAAGAKPAAAGADTQPAPQGSPPA